MNVGQRVRLNERCVWPERVGCAGVIVEPSTVTEAGRYPWHGRGPNEVILLLDNDPLGDGEGRGWSCATSLDTLEAL